MRDGYAAGAQRDLRWRNREIRQPGGVRQCIDGYGEATGPSADWNENHIGHRESARWRISALEMVEPERTFSVLAVHRCRTPGEAGAVSTCNVVRAAINDILIKADRDVVSAHGVRARDLYGDRSRCLSKNSEHGTAARARRGGHCYAACPQCRVGSDVECGCDGRGGSHIHAADSHTGSADGNACAARKVGSRQCDGYAGTPRPACWAD